MLLNICRKPKIIKNINIIMQIEYLKHLHILIQLIIFISKIYLRIRERIN